MPLRSSRVNKTRKRTSSVVSDSEKQPQDGSRTDSKKRQKTSVDTVKSSNIMSTDKSNTTKVCDNTNTSKLVSARQSEDQVVGNTPQSTAAIIPVFGKRSSPKPAKKQPSEDQRKNVTQSSGVDCSSATMMSEALNECTDTKAPSFAGMYEFNQGPPVLCEETGGLTTPSVENETRLMPELRITEVKVNENPEVTPDCERTEDELKMKVRGEGSETESTRDLDGQKEGKSKSKKSFPERGITTELPLFAYNDEQDEKAVMKCAEGVSADNLVSSETENKDAKVITNLTEKEQKERNKTTDDEELPVTKSAGGQDISNRTDIDEELVKLAETGQKISNRTGDDEELTKLTGTAGQKIFNRATIDGELTVLAETGQEISRGVADDEEVTTKEELSRIKQSAAPTVSLAAGSSMINPSKQTDCDKVSDMKPDKAADKIINHPPLMQSGQDEDFLLDDAVDVMDFTSSQLLKLEEAESSDLVQSEVVHPAAAMRCQTFHLQAVGGETVSDGGTSQPREQRQAEGRAREVMRKMMKDLNEIKLVTGSLLSQMSQYRKHRSQRQPQPSTFGLGTRHQTNSGTSAVQPNKTRGSMTSQFKKH